MMLKQLRRDIAFLLGRTGWGKATFGNNLNPVTNAKSAKIPQRDEEREKWNSLN
jgi:putative ribosome biogenesis GTPase RsgA